MSHLSSTVIIKAGVLEMFDPDEYANVREHFTAQELAKADQLRAYPETHVFTLLEKLEVIGLVSKAILTSEG